MTPDMAAASLTLDRAQLESEAMEALDRAGCPARVLEGIDMRPRVALAPVLLAMAVTAAVAQSQAIAPAAASRPAASARPTSAPVSATAASGGTGFQSAFEGYRRFDDQPVGSWREANDLVGRIGGWQAYAREGQGEGHDMGAMKDMPGMSKPGIEPKPSGAAAEKSGAAGHDMGSMKAMPGMSMPATGSKPTGTPESEGAGGRPKDSMKDMPGMSMPSPDSKPVAGSSRKDIAADHGTGSMKKTPGMAMSGMDAQHADATSRKQSAAAGHDISVMKDMPGRAMSGMGAPAAGEAKSMEGTAAMGMGKSAGDSAGKSRPDRVTGTGVVQAIDKPNGKVKLTHDPIAALGWPRMTMFFRLQASALAEKVKEGDAVDFSLAKSASGYVISALEKRPARAGARP